MDEVAVKMLFADRGKLFTALVGVVFAVVLVNVQGGLFIGLIRKASLLVDQGSADIWVGHRRMNNVDFPHDIPRQWIHRVRSIEGVERAEPYVVGHSVMTLPSGGFEQVLVVGSDSASLLGGVSQLAVGDPQSIREPDAIFLDTGDLDKVENPQIGEVREIGRRRARIAGYTEGILGFLVTPYVFTTLDRASDYLRKPTDRVSYFLVELSPGADTDQVQGLIRQRLPDAETMTCNEYAWVSIDYWLRRTGIGLSFGAATGLGLIVGLIVVGQTLYASVLDRMNEFATLKAIGANESQIRAVVLCQALLLALVGSAIGLVVTGVLQTLLDNPRAPISIPWLVSVGSCVMVTAICLVASLAPYLRLRRIDPALVLH
ncbi:outer membrane-specific lipoprotein transporter subunit LolE [Pseudobythopirellula maris]|uniref:Outer membrane-specific lipoprotein transporter subunit LolE n=1 Tax=Pseudobythopirellula maris TaxID=2527991 RepID=A0A5C5ZS06_9BACT|nr:FtsX-like permease family protein [Pseudobythopirellula maris]TWT89717.1 outer membrane-specific lipoprotein transporter subunit LolE [Pseudobythopirellula maris]